MKESELYEGIENWTLEYISVNVDEDKEKGGKKAKSENKHHERFPQIKQQMWVCEKSSNSICINTF